MTLSVMIVGEAGAGKSSAINLLANRLIAPVSDSVENCTKVFVEYTFQADSTQVRAYDTIGFSPARVGNSSHLVPYENACRLIQSLKSKIDLIFFCTSANKLTPTTQYLYHLINDFFFDHTVPIALVVTHRDRERSMEDWWVRNLREIHRLGLKFAAHACIDAGRYPAMAVDPRYQQSRDKLIELLAIIPPHNGTVLNNPPYPLLDRLDNASDILVERCGLSPKDADNLTRKVKPLLRIANIVLFGEAGVGKSSLINLIAGHEIAMVSSRVRGCTLQSQEYRLSANTSHVRIFDTVGLNCAAVEQSDYLRGIKNAYKLIQALNRAGGVDLLLFCIRGSRLSDAQRSNYKLFREYLCDKKIPVAIVVTHLENEDDMEKWWNDNKEDLITLEIDCVGHACITAINKNLECFGKKREASRTSVLELLNTHVRDPGVPFVMDTEKWLSAFLKKMGNFIRGGRVPRRRAIMDMLVTECQFSRDAANAILDEMRL